jgi:hypothetical protein
MKFHIALLGALLLAPFAQAMEWRKILKDDLSKPALAAIQVETIRNDGEMIIVRVTNKTDEKIKYRGYSKDSA